MARYIGTVGPPTANIMLVGEAPGAEEDRTGLPFKGPAGKTLNILLAKAGVIREECLIANVARERPPKNNIGYYFHDKKQTIPKPELSAWIEELKRDIETYKPNIVIALGATALWALTGIRGIKSARGYIMESTLVPGQKVLPTYHPQAVGYSWNLSYIAVLDLKKALYHSAFPGIRKDSRTFDIDPSKDAFIDICKNIFLKENKPLAVDIEATKAHINRIGFSNSPYWGVSLGILDGSYPRFPERDELEIWYWIAKVLSSVPLVFHNATYDISVLWKRNHIYCKDIYMDTMIAAHCCWPELPRSLDFVSSICLDVPMWKFLSHENPGFYNVQDAINTAALIEPLKDRLKAHKEEETFKREMSWIKPAAMMQLQGIDVSIEKRDKIRNDAEKRLKEIDEKLFSLTGRKDINYNSPDQIKKLLYIDLGLPPQFKRRKSVKEDRKITTEEKALKTLARMHEVPAYIIKRRKCQKLISTFLDIEASPEGKIYTSYNITGTDLGGRWSSSKSIIDPYGPGNLQNIPNAARKLYTVSDDEVLLEADYVQAEAVVVAYLSLDMALMKMFKESFGMSPSERKKDYDVHRYTASIMYEIDIDDVTSEQRSIGKTLRHAGNYAAGPGVVADKLNITMQQAKPLLKKYFDKNPMLVLWHKRIQEELRRSRTLVNLFGRSHLFLDRWGEALFRRAYSYIPQTSVGDLLNSSLRDFYEKYGDKYKIYLQLHDAIYLRIPKREVDTVIPLLRNRMIKEIPVGQEIMKIDVDFKMGPNWGEMKELDISWR